MSTEVITPAVVVEVAAPKKKKRRRRRLIIVLGIVLALLVVAFVVADGVAKSYAAGYVKAGVIAALKIDPKTPVQVDLGAGSIILQAITGRIDKVTVDATSLSFGDLTGAAHIVATNVPLDSNKPLDTLGITVTITQENVRKLAKIAGGLDIKKLDVGNGVITVGTDLSVLFLTIPVSVDLEPSAKDGAISFEPKSVKLGDKLMAVADLRADRQFAAIAGALLAAQQVCVASSLPSALKIGDVHVVKNSLVVNINGDGTALNGPGLSTYGTCPAAK